MCHTGFFWYQIRTLFYSKPESDWNDVFYWFIIIIMSWSVTVSTRCFHCSRSWLYFHSDLRPRLRGWRFASRMRSQVWQGRPGGRLQSLGIPLMETLSALVMSSDVSILATCPKNRSRLTWMSWDSWGGEPAWSLTVALVTWSVYGMRMVDNDKLLLLHCWRFHVLWSCMQCCYLFIGLFTI